jgi:hypothetical protein
MIRTSAFLAVAACCAFAPLALAAGPVYTDPTKADEDFALQGEYVGELETRDGKRKFAVQAIALGDGKFHAVAYPGGLPGDGWNGERHEPIEGQRDGQRIVFKSDKGEGIIENGALSVHGSELARVERKSPTLGENPPAGAVVLFDGTSADGWKGGRMTDDGLLMEGCTSEKTFGDHRLHIEFRLPYQPHDRGQQRGNSGIYLQGRYEVQMLDSFGLEGKHNECGGIYSVKDPEVNMCLPPLSWQTYDIDYTAAKYDDSGKLVANPRVTVRHNGVVIHNDIELPGDRSTTAAPMKPGPEPGPIYLQNHGNPVRYRNIWVVPKT